METGYRNSFRRIGSTGATVAAVAMLALPAHASAAESDPVVTGSCAATVKGEDGDPVTVDSGLGLSVSLGAKGKGSVSVPVAETVNGLGLSESKPVSGTAGEVCDTGKDTVNALTEPVKGALSAKETKTPDPGDTQQGDSPPVGDPDPDVDAQPDSKPVRDATTDTPEPRPDDTRDESTQSPGTTVGGGWGRVTIDRSPSPLPTRDEPDTPRGREHTVHADDRAAHDVEAMERLPLLLAVLALVLVSAALAHTWARRALLG